MFDNCQRTIEKLAPEMSSYLKRGIFNKKEIDQIVNKRTIFENKCDRTNKRISDFINYIKSEETLETIRNRKIKKSGIGFEESDNLLTKNIISIYTRALHHFINQTSISNGNNNSDNDKSNIGSNDGFNVALLDNFVFYCKKRKLFNEDLKTVIKNLCLKNITNYKLWIYCGKVLSDFDDIEESRNLFMTILSMISNKNSLLEIYLSFFDMELKYVEKLNKLTEDFEIDQNEKDEVEKGKIVIFIFNEIIKIIKDLNKNIIENSEVVKYCLERAKIVPNLNEEMLKIINENS